MGYARDFPECVLDLATVALLKHEDRHTRLSELVSRWNEFVVLLLAGVADEDESGHLEQAGFALSVGEDLADLCPAGAAMDARHQPSELVCVCDPARTAACREVAVINQLDTETADGGDSFEHVALELAGHVPGVISARGG